MALVDSRNQTLWQLRERYVPRGVAQAHPVFVARAEGSRIWDVDGKEYLDFAGGIGVMNVGHGHPRVLQAVRAQLERFTHVCFQVTPYEAYVRLAERLAKLAPGDFSKKTLFLTTGAEAVENAVKIARAYTGRPAVVALTHSFHGLHLVTVDEPQRGISRSGYQVVTALVHEGHRLVRTGKHLNIHLASRGLFKGRDPVVIGVRLTPFNVARPSQDVKLPFQLSQALPHLGGWNLGIARVQ